MWPIRIREHECGLLIRDGQFVRALWPGLHWIWRPWRMRVDRISRLEPRVGHALAEQLSGDPSLRGRLERIELGGSQRALVWFEDRLACIVGEGRHVFWKNASLRIERHDAREIRLAHPRAALIARHAAQTTLLAVVTAADDEQILIFRDDVLIDAFGPGTHLLWQSPRCIRWKIVAAGELLGAGEITGSAVPAQCRESGAVLAPDPLELP